MLVLAQEEDSRGSALLHPSVWVLGREKSWVRPNMEEPTPL